jgi:hypothetical protein
MSKEMDANTEKFEHIELFGKSALFTNNRIDRSTVPGGYYAYDLRHGDSGDFSTVEPTVRVNHAGTVITTVALKFKNESDKYKKVKNAINFLDDDEMTLAEFAAHAETKSA